MARPTPAEIALACSNHLQSLDLINRIENVITETTLRVGMRVYPTDPSAEDKPGILLYYRVIPPFMGIIAHVGRDDGTLTNYWLDELASHLPRTGGAVRIVSGSFNGRRGILTDSRGLKAKQQMVEVQLTDNLIFHGCRIRLRRN